MEPTPRATAIASVVGSVLADIRQQIVTHRAFDTATVVRTFSLAMPDVVEMAMLPEILARVAKQAPSVDIRTTPMDARQLTGALQRSEVDLAIGNYPELSGDDVFQQRLFRHHFLCLVRADHPVLATGMTLKAFETYPHAVVRLSSGSHNPIDEALRAEGIQRRKMLESAHFLTIPMAVANTDMIVTLPAIVAKVFARFSNVEALEPPFATPTVDVKQYWHRSQQSDLGNQWLRTLVSDLFTQPSTP
jgi:DNA-binding transcriptional LysR family regulator